MFWACHILSLLLRLARSCYSVTEVTQFKHTLDMECDKHDAMYWEQDPGKLSQPPRQTNVRQQTTGHCQAMSPSLKNQVDQVTSSWLALQTKQVYGVL